MEGLRVCFALGKDKEVENDAKGMKVSKEY